MSASWADQVKKEEAMRLLSVSSGKEEANRFSSVSVSDFHGSLYDVDIDHITCPE
jgi:hypothetical protein